jgi:proteasome lid subunit RPN8/RPN11
VRITDSKHKENQIEEFAVSYLGKSIWTIEGQARKKIIGHTVDNYPHEACGILLCPFEKSQYISVAHPTKNVTLEDPGRRYLIDPLEFIEVDRWADQRGFDICGFYHSHPDHPPVPSDHDRSLAWEGYLYLIVSVQGGKFDESRAWIYDQSQQHFDEVTVQYKNGKKKASEFNSREPSSVKGL